MPFRVEWRDEAKVAFRRLGPTDIMATRKLVGSFQHDRWLSGRAVPGPASPGTELMELRNGPVRLLYELNRAEESVFIRAIVRD